MRKDLAINYKQIKIGFYSHMKHNPKSNLCKSQSCVCNKLVLGQSVSYARGQTLFKADPNIPFALCSSLLVLSPETQDNPTCLS